jgi:hypothetical protein
MIHTGSDDGLVQVTKDAGVTWTKLNGSWPKQFYGKQVVASIIKKIVFMLLKRLQRTTLLLGVYKSDDAGKTWSSIAANCQYSSVIIEHPTNENMVFCEPIMQFAEQAGAWSLPTRHATSSSDRKFSPKANDLSRPAVIHLQGQS